MASGILQNGVHTNTPRVWLTFWFLGWIHKLLWPHNATESKYKEKNLSLFLSNSHDYVKNEFGCFHTRHPAARHSIGGECQASGNFRTRHEVDGRQLCCRIHHQLLGHFFLTRPLEKHRPVAKSPQQCSLSSQTKTASLADAGMLEKYLWRQSYACPAKPLECVAGTLAARPRTSPCESSHTSTFS